MVVQFSSLPRSPSAVLVGVAFGAQQWAVQLRQYVMHLTCIYMYNIDKQGESRGDKINLHQ